MTLRFVAWVILAVSLSGCVTSGFSDVKSAETVEKGTRDAYATIHQLETEQAADVWSRMGWHDADNQPWADYAVKVYTGGPVIGSLLEGEEANVVSNTACKPAAAPDSGDINVFSSYDISGTLAASIGLPIPHLPLGLSADRENTASYSFEGATMRLLPQDDLDALLKTPSCSKRITQIKGSGWIVRGLISAKRTYSFYRKSGGGVTLSLSNSANSVTDANSIKGYGTDSHFRVYFMILKPVGSAMPQSVISEVTPVAGTGDCSKNFGSKIYIQKDKSADNNVGINLPQALSGRFNVVKQIQAVDSDHMPSATQVRYYNTTDKAAAECVAVTVRDSGYPAPRVVMLNLPSPPNQLEIWLTLNKAGS